MTDHQSTTFLFDVELDWQEDLKEGSLSVRFRQKFKENKITLSSNVNFVEPKEKSGPWRIRDEDEHHTYLVARTKEALEIHSPSDVILVVKGAGLHKASETLDLFIQGFWPAVMKLMPKSDSATSLAARQEHEILQDYKPPPHIKKEHQHLVEISVRDPSKTGKRKEAVSHRILVKEAYWELGENPPGHWKQLFNEWHMATYALRREISNYLRGLTFRSLKALLTTIWKRTRGWIPSRFAPIQNRTQSVVQRVREGALANRIKQARSLLATYGERVREGALANRAKRLVTRAELSVQRVREGALAARINRLGSLLVTDWEFIFIFFSFWLTYSLIGTQVLIPLSSNVTTLIGLEDMTDLFEYQFSFVVAALMALPVSWFPTLQIYHRNTYQEKRLPGMQRWIVVPMIFAFILNTWGYLGWLVRLLILIVLANIYRGLWWRYRKEANTDREYRRYKGGFLIVMDLQPLTVIYRMMMVWILPIAFLLLSIAEILVTTKVLSGFGKTIEEWLNDFFGGKLSDVSAYAMDPSFALRIRSAVEYDLKFFHQMGLVDNIHVFAHSQGTPITFETLFTHMPKEYRKKIKTYVTIGSVLGYYYQVAPVLEEVYSPERFRKADYELDTFAEGFRWFNCWNLLDNITGFYGLDEYDLELMEENKNKRATEARYPTNIKTRTRGHSDYWTNLDEVQVPFARRVLYDKVDEKWKPTIRVKGPIQRIGAFLTWLCSLGLAGGTYAIIASLASRTRNWPQIWDGIGGAFGALFKALAKIEFLKTMFDFDTVALLFMDREKFKETWFFAQLNETPVYGWLNDILGWILGNLGGILGGIIAFYIGVQIVKVVCFLQRSKES